MKTYTSEILEKRKQLSIDNYECFSKKICQKIEELDEYQNAENLLIYYPYLGEADVLYLVNKAFNENKNIYFPKVLNDSSMAFIKVDSLHQFEEGYKGIKEPKGNEVFDKSAICSPTIMILPGSIFDTFGNRNGYGKGYYDRYLEDCHTDITKVGVCFSLQMLSKIPDIKPWDVPMDYVVNEDAVIKRKK